MVTVFSLKVWESNLVPDTPELADKPRLCLTDALTTFAHADYNKLLNHIMYSVNANLGSMI